MLIKYLIVVIVIMFFIFLVGCTKLPVDFLKVETHAYDDTGNTLLGKAVAKRKGDRIDESGFYLMGNGLDAFVARAALAQYAEESIDLQYYIFHNDLVGKLLIDQLLKAADRGVRVRILLDDLDMGGSDDEAIMMDSHPNIQVRLFNPFNRTSGRISQLVTHERAITRRMHNKSFTVDNQVTILGGRNIGNEYFEADPSLKFADLDVMGIGNVANKVSVSFDEYWNSELSYPIHVLNKKTYDSETIKQKRQLFNTYIESQKDSAYLKALHTSDVASKVRNQQLMYEWGNADVIYDDPQKILSDFSDTTYHLTPQLAPYVEHLENELIIFSPYFVPGKAGTKFLTDLVEKGVKVRILTNSLASNDVGIVHSGYSKYRKALLRGGVELYELNVNLTKEERKTKKEMKSGGASKASLHAKSFVFDRKQVFIGSLNLDPRSAVHNTEIGVIINSKDIAENMVVDFDKLIKAFAFRLELIKGEEGYEQILWHGLVDGKLKTFTNEPYTSFWRRVGIGFMMILPVESQL